MKGLVRKFRRLGKRQLLALVGSAALALAAVVLVFTPRPFLSIVPLTVLLLHLALQIVLIQYRVVMSLGEIARVRKQSQKTFQQPSHAPAPNAVTLASLERVEFLQKRILAALEVERLEADERQQALLANRN